MTVNSDTREEDLRQVAAAAFTAWTDQLAERLRTAGMSRAAARNLAHMMITLLEGAHVLCRAAGNTEPFEHAARSLTSLIRAQDDQFHSE